MARTTDEAARPAARGPGDVVAAATSTYLRCEPIDMSALATGLGIGRATLYRWVGNREDLLEAVIARATERTFRAAARGARGRGADLVIDLLGRFMQAVVAAPALAALTRREPILFLRLATMPGLIEQRAAALLGEVMEAEQAAGRLALALPAAVLASAAVRICDAHLYAPLLGRRAPEIDTALDLVALLLGHRRPSRPGGPVRAPHRPR